MPDIDYVPNDFLNQWSKLVEQQKNYQIKLEEVTWNAIIWKTLCLIHCSTWESS